MRRVLVTRPEPGATATALRLSALGFEPVLMPLTETRPIGSSRPPDFPAFDAVALTSSAAVRHAPQSLLDGFSHLPLFAVGHRTAEAAVGAGFRRVESADGEAVALAGLIARRLPQGARIAWLCGLVRTAAFGERLQDAGYDVTPVETYDTRPLAWSTDAARAALDRRAVDDVLIYSTNTAVQFSRVMASAGIGDLLHGARLLCISAKAAGALPQSVRTHAEVAARPDEAAMLALLEPGQQAGSG